jgi:hypothetical protein
MLVVTKAVEHRMQPRSRGVWVPACAGTTRGEGLRSAKTKTLALAVIASEAKQSTATVKADCFVAEPVIGRAFARPVGSSQ